MQKLLTFALGLAFTGTLSAQQEPATDSSWKKEYRASATRINDLVHTKLELKPDFKTSHMDGRAWVTLQPHFYPTDSVTLDAKGFAIRKIAIERGGKQVALKYTYDEQQLHITLDKMYKAGDKYTLYIDYTSMPNEYDQKYSYNQLLGIKGLYFINPLGDDKTKPTQLWTQGETESNSAWFPTIDRTNQKTTEELTVTVPSIYVTLSNGKLVSQKKNADGTRTDYWKQDLPHAPYLFFLGVGEYDVTHDTWRGKEVNYYVEKEYAPVARKIFGNTPEMMTFFSAITGVPFPWVKYSQITGRDYVAGAMENTTATIHQNYAQQDARELVDGNGWEETIAHELFHQWFGDYVTAESWSNITLNESFADYSQTLWDQYKYGRDAGDQENYKGLASYLQGGGFDKDLVRFHYADREDVFDNVSYQKGGRVLHMLRNLVGDSAFFKSLNLYLNTNKFRSAEAQQLRLAFEEVTGRDLNWFFNQWYYGSGHPVVSIDYVYDDAAGNVRVIIRQNQLTGKLFQLPLAIDVYGAGTKKRYNFRASNAVDTFTIPYTQRPSLVNVDGDKILLWDKKDNKTLDNFIAQYRLGGIYMDRREAVEAAAKNITDPKAIALLKLALDDPFTGIRGLAINRISLSNEAARTALERGIARLGASDPDAIVRTLAIAALTKLNDVKYMPLFRKAVSDSSYSVSGAGLLGITSLDQAAGLAIAKELYKQPAKGTLKTAIMNAFAKSGDEPMFDKVLKDFESLDLQSRFGELSNVTTYLQSLRNTEKFKAGVDVVTDFRERLPEAIKAQVDGYIGDLLEGVLEAKKKALTETPNDVALKQQVDYLATKMGKKGF